ncbi:MAG: hypothetical protein JW810_03440 [Sedimentisphaerales bacterium]|nr:hypothetical protein [Sedimentisphaerales bacterium]
MVQMLIRMQEACLGLESWHLLLPGVVAVLLGLFLWLGGMRYAFLVVGLIGAVSGGILGLQAAQWFSLQRPLAVAGCALVLTILALLLKQVVVVLLAGALFAVAAGATYMTYIVDRQYDPQAQPTAIQAPPDGATTAPAADFAAYPPAGSAATSLPLPADGSAGGWETMRAIRREWQDIAWQNRTMLMIWASLGALGGLVLGYLLRRIMMAVCCSIIGASGAIVGMSAVFLAKGTPVVLALQARPRFLPALFFLMVIFGCLMQLAFAGTKKIAAPSEKEENE